MGQFVKGDVAILCQITGLSVGDSYALVLSNADFAAGSLHQNSNIRPSRIFTADSNIIQYRAGVVTPEKICEVTNRIVEIVSA